MLFLISFFFKNRYAKIYNARNHIDGENFKLKFCTCAENYSRGTRTKFQHEILIKVRFLQYNNCERIFWRARETLVKHPLVISYQKCFLLSLDFVVRDFRVSNNFLKSELYAFDFVGVESIGVRKTSLPFLYNLSLYLLENKTLFTALVFIFIKFYKVKAQVYIFIFIRWLWNKFWSSLESP